MALEREYMENYQNLYNSKHWKTRHCLDSRFEGNTTEFDGEKSFLSSTQCTRHTYVVISFNQYLNYFSIQHIQFQTWKSGEINSHAIYNLCARCRDAKPLSVRPAHLKVICLRPRKLQKHNKQNSHRRTRSYYFESNYGE